MTGALYYGDNVQVLRDHVASASVDLVYLDPPFNSNASYNVLFRAPTGEQAQAQIEAFEDTWHWNDVAERAFDEVIGSGNSNAADLLRAMRSFLGDNDMMAYLAMMAVRLIELHRILNPTGPIKQQLEIMTSRGVAVQVERHLHEGEGSRMRAAARSLPLEGEGRGWGWGHRSTGDRY